MVRDAAALAWVVNLGCLDLNPHPVRAEDLDHPDELRIDLDPMPGVDWSRSSTSPWSPGGARRPRPDRLAEDVGIARLPHLRAHRAALDVREVRLAAERVAREVENRAPSWPPAGGGRRTRQGVFVDFNQNAKDRTVASAYSVPPTRRPGLDAARPGTRCATADPEDSRCRRCCSASPRSATLGRHRRRPRVAGGAARLAERSARPRSRPKVAPAGASPRCRSSRSRGPRPSRRRSRGLEQWKARHPSSCATSSLPTSWSTACADGARSGTASASTCSTFPEPAPAAGTTRGRLRPEGFSPSEEIVDGLDADRQPDEVGRHL